MRDLLTVPSPETDDAIVNIADWAELSAFLGAVRAVSREDIVRALYRTYSLPEAAGRTKAGDVFNELADRVNCCYRRPAKKGTAAYPFRIERNQAVLSLRPHQSRNPDYGLIYLFLLAISRANMDSRSRVLAGIDPTKVFERMCAEVLATFWGGHSDVSGAMVFGTARGNKTAFRAKIEDLCDRLKEGVGWRPDAKSPGAGDGKLDVVAWRRFFDDRQGSLVGFAQCKTGVHWQQHLPKLQPEVFCRRFMQKTLILHPVRLYMVPCRVERRDWETHTGEGGILFDRCRVVQYAQGVSAAVVRDCRGWLREALKLQKERRFTP
jgi:hypothetical protein